MYQCTNKIKLFSQNVLNSLILLFFCLYLVSCSNTTNKNKSTEVNVESMGAGNKKSDNRFTDTLVIDFTAAVIYNPDSLQLEKLKVFTKPMDFESNVHECIYLLRFSWNEIKNNWPKIKIIETGNAGFVLFKSEEGNEEYIDLNTRKDFCGIFLFDGHKKVHFADLANIATELGFYFSK